MLDTLTQVIADVADSEIGKSARSAARTIWSAHLGALKVTRQEAGKVFATAAGSLLPLRKSRVTRKPTTRRRSASRAAA